MIHPLLEIPRSHCLYVLGDFFFKLFTSFIKEFSSLLTGNIDTECQHSSAGQNITRVSIDHAESPCFQICTQYVLCPVFSIPKFKFSQ